MKLSFNYKKVLIVACVLAVFSIVSVILVGFGGDTLNNRTMVVAYLPYGTDYDWVDTDQLLDDFKEIIGRKCEVGFSSNFLDGFTNLIVTIPSVKDVSEENVLNLLSDKYADLGIESVEVYKLKADIDNSVILNALFILMAFAIVFALYGLIVIKDSAYVLSTETVTVLSTLITLGLLTAARIPVGANITAAVVVSCLSSIGCTCWILGNLLVITKASKKKNSDVAAGKAQTLGLSITIEAAITAILVLAGIGIAAIICGESSVAYTALAVSLPILVSAILSQLLAIGLYTKN